MRETEGSGGRDGTDARARSGAVRARLSCGDLPAEALPSGVRSEGGFPDVTASGEADRQETLLEQDSEAMATEHGFSRVGDREPVLPADEQACKAQSFICTSPCATHPVALSRCPAAPLPHCPTAPLPHYPTVPLSHYPAAQLSLTPSRNACMLTRLGPVGCRKRLIGSCWSAFRRRGRASSRPWRSFSVSSEQRA